MGMDWKVNGWRWVVEGGRYEIEGPSTYSDTYDVYWFPEGARIVFLDAPNDSDGERVYWTTLEAAQGACRAHYNERRVAPVMRLVGA